VTGWIDTPGEDLHWLARAGNRLRVAGWAFLDDGPADTVSVAVNEVIVARAAPTGTRPDVANAYPSLGGGGERLGFEFDLELPDLEPGAHRLRVLAQRGHDEPRECAAREFTAVSPAALASPAERFAFVPDELVLKVNGSRDYALFENIGRLTVRTIRHYVPRPDLADALDFGCGLGRVLVPFKAQCPGARFTGFDIDPRMIDWARFLCGDLAHAWTLDARELPSGSFDLVYAISVFTHLDESTDEWLAQIARLLRPGGQAFISYHDETLFAEHAGTPFIPGTRPGQALDRYFVTGRGTDEGGAAMGTYYETAYWVERVAPFLDVETTVPRGLLDYQSISVARKR